MPGSSGGQTTTQRSEPWDAQKPYLTEGYGEAQSLYNRGPAQYYPGSTVANQSPETQYAQNAIWNRANSPAAYETNAQNSASDFMQGKFIDNASTSRLRALGQGEDFADNPVFSNLTGLAQGGGNLGANAASRVGDLTATGGNNLAQYRQDVGDIISGSAGAANPALGALATTAGGAYLNGSPYLDAMYGKAASGLTRQFAEGVSPGLDSAASRAGRYGSGMHANVKDAAGESFGRQLGDLATGIYGGAYDQERGRQEAATRDLSNLYTSNLGLRASTAGTSAGQGTADAQTRLAASGQLSGAEGQDVSNMLAANAQQSDAYKAAADRMMQALSMDQQNSQYGRGLQLQAANLAPELQQMDYTNLNNASAVGQARDQYSQQQLNADIARHDFGQNADWQNLSRYLAAVQGGSPGGTSSVTTSGGSNPLATIFGGLGGLGQLAMGTRGLLW